jgi:septation ring formation regulator EzrA
MRQKQMRWKKLSYDEMKKGIELCHENVYRLLHSAERELNAGQYATATMLSILAVEEQARTAGRAFNCFWLEAC